VPLSDPQLISAILYIAERGFDKLDFAFIGLIYFVPVVERSC
jgi:hypothetical protein